MKKKGQNIIKNILCILMCAFIFFGSAEPSFGIENAPPGDSTTTMDKGIQVQPLINMPLNSYEGHKILISDESLYTINGEKINVKDVYSKGIAWSEFSVVDGSDNDAENLVDMHRGKYESYQREAVFSKPGNYGIEMVIHCSDGRVYHKKQRINIEKAPYTTSMLTGAQKQNRLQLIDFRTSQNPSYPVCDIELCITVGDSSEKASVVFMKDGQTVNSINGSKHIKLRNAVNSISEESFFVTGGTELMSTFESKTNFIYEITAVDSRGNKYIYNHKFIVETDKAPVAAMDLPESFIRKENSNEAVITVEDISQTDGDSLKREWYVKYNGEDGYRNVSDEPGYTDMSDGSAARVSFIKKGTGRFRIKLIVHDVWSEGTMDEYTSDVKRLSDSAECDSEVVNTAPHVSIGAHKLKSSDIVVLSEDNKDLSTLEQSFREKFLSQGVESRFSAEKSNTSRADGYGSGKYIEKFQTISPFGFAGENTAFEDDLYIIDDSKLYYIEASWSDPDDGKPEEPFFIIADDAETGSELWRYAIKSNIFSLDIINAHMYQDDTEKYLYITSSGKTLIINKNTGQSVTVADYEFGEYNFVYGDFIYTFTAGGVYSISLSDGRMSAIWHGDMSGTVRRISGMPTTYIRTSQETVLRLTLDLNNGNISKKYVGKLPDELYINAGDKIGVKTTLNVAGIDVNGRAILEINTPIYYERVKEAVDCYRTVIQIYDSDGEMIKQIVRQNEERMKSVPVIDKNGAFNYFAVTYSMRHAVKAEVNGIDNNYLSSTALYDSDGRPAYYNQIIYSFENDGYVYLTLGGICTWIYGQTWANGSTHGYPERCTNISFDLNSGTAAETYLPAGCTGFSEYARRSELYTAIHSGRNSQEAGYAQVDNTVVKRSQSVYEMLYRAMKKNLRIDNDADYKILLLKNLNSGAISDEEADKLSETAKAAGYSIYIYYNNDSAKKIIIPDAEYLADDDDIADTIVKKTVSEKAKNHKYTSVESTGKNALLSRSFSLKGDKKYYFEYKVKSDSEPEESVSVSHSLLPVLGNEIYDSGRLYVTGSEIEDFDDDDLNSFFRYDNYDSAGGMYTDCYSSRNGNANAYIEKDSKISFKVPEGKRGVLSFEYVIFNPDKGDRLNANYADIDGKRWDVSPGTTGRGCYIHPDILEPGEHTIRLHTSSYGAKIINYTYVDDMKISYVSNELSDSEKTYSVSGYSAAKQSEDIYIVTGSFETPGEATCYSEMKDVEYIAGKAGEAEYTRLDISEPDGDRYFYIELPEGKTAVSPSVILRSKCSGKDNVRYQMGELPEANCYSVLKSEGDKLSLIDKEWKYIMPLLSGSNVFHTYADSYRRISGSFEDVEMYVTGGSNILTDRNRYVKSVNNAGRKTLFLSENGYGDKSEIKINLPNNVSEIYDFRLYMIEDGKKLYIAENDFTDAGTAEKWMVENAVIKYNEYSLEDSGEINVFSKGQYVDYNVVYWDYEGDPSKKSYWKYTHTPYNDGAFEQASTILNRDGNILSERNIILNEPVTRFYKDGKYTVEHWQEDDTTRGAVHGGDSVYDKESNHVFITFYIGSIGDAPWIRYIKTIPSDIYEGDDIGLEVEVDDAKKSVLRLETEVYCGNELIYTGTVDDIKADEGNYLPVIINGIKQNAECGIYKVVCSVSSAYGVSADSIRFTVMSRGNIEGTVYHTDKWDENRKFVGREKDIFWPGEKLMLKADTEGFPVSVTAWMEGEEDEVYQLSPAEEGVYRGNIWNENMMFRWGSDVIEKKIIFRADYKGGIVKMSEYKIIFDNKRLYWNIHRTQGA